MNPKCLRFISNVESVFVLWFKRRSGTPIHSQLVAAFRSTSFFSNGRNVDLWVGFARRREQIAVCYLGGRDLCALGPSRFLLGSISPESATASPKRATEVDQTAADRVIACSPPHQGGCWDVIQRERARCSSAAGCQPPARLSDSQQLLANKSADLFARSLAETGQIPSPHGDSARVSWPA